MDKIAGSPSRNRKVKESACAAIQPGQRSRINAVCTSSAEMPNTSFLLEREKGSKRLVLTVRTRKTVS